MSVGRPNPDVYIKAARVAGTEATYLRPLNTAIRAHVRLTHSSGAMMVQVPDLKEASDQMYALWHTVALEFLSGARSIGLFGE